MNDHTPKFYTNDAVHSQNKGTGYGAVINSPDGHLKSAVKMIDTVTLLSLAAEVQAIIHGIRLLQRLQIKEASVFSNSFCAISMINGEQQVPPEVFHLMVHIQDMCKSFFFFFF